MLGIKSNIKVELDPFPPTHSPAIFKVKINVFYIALLRLLSVRVEFILYIFHEYHFLNGIKFYLKNAIKANKNLWVRSIFSSFDKQLNKPEAVIK